MAAQAHTAMVAAADESQALQEQADAVAKEAEDAYNAVRAKLEHAQDAASGTLVADAKQAAIKAAEQEAAAAIVEKERVKAAEEVNAGVYRGEVPAPLPPLSSLHNLASHLTAAVTRRKRPRSPPTPLSLTPLQTSNRPKPRSPHLVKRTARPRV